MIKKELHELYQEFRFAKNESVTEPRHTFLGTKAYMELKFGDWFLFRHVEPAEYDAEKSKYRYRQSRPILAIFAGYGVCDMALVVNFIAAPRAVSWLQLWDDIPLVEQIYDWDDTLIPLGIWKQRPTYKQLREVLKGYGRIDLQDKAP